MKEFYELIEKSENRVEIKYKDLIDLVEELKKYEKLTKSMAEYIFRKDFPQQGSPEMVICNFLNEI